MPARIFTGKLRAVSESVTQGIRVRVRTSYLREQSDPLARRYAFAYTITIANEGKTTVQLRTRHWIITDASGEIEEVKGEGVVGQQPTLQPGQSFQYTSGCVLKTPWGTMNGTYQMYREDQSWFDAEIAPFLLALPTVTAARDFN